MGTKRGLDRIPAPRADLRCGGSRFAKGNAMAKGQMKTNKETKKPKAEKPKVAASAYKLSQGKGPQSSTTPPGKK